MAVSAEVDRPRPVGRAGEVADVVGLVRDAARGHAGALLVSGEAGVGKTALVREACAQVASVAAVLWAPCLPLTSLAVPFLPLISALREWAAGRDAPAPMLHPSTGRAAGDGPVEFDAWLDDLCRTRAVVLVVDDLQWADQSTLDVLMYVLAGLAGRRLAVVTTVRSGEVGEGHPLRRWLADVRRLPGVRELGLGRLDRVATAGQIAGLLGRSPHESLVDEVFARTHGNAYMTTLLVRGLPPDATGLPAGLPTELRDAATDAWHRLSPSAREVARLIAVAGHPQSADQLREVAGAIGLDGDLVPLLRSAVDGAVLQVGADGGYWFVHPLLAEVLEEGLLPEERRSLHAAFVAALEPHGDAADRLGAEQAVDLADHYHRGGNPQEAYRWALRGAEAAERGGGAAEMLRLLRRALALYGEVHDAGISRVELLQRIKDAAERAGEQTEELRAVNDLLALVDRDHQPLLAAGLLVRRMELRLSTGQEFASLTDVREAVRLSAGHPGSAEHAWAMGELAHAELWHSVPSGAATADEAVRLARACGSPKALAYALAAKVMARLQVDDLGGLAEGQEAQAAAAQARDFWGYVHASLWASNCLDSESSLEVIEHRRRSREELTSLGGPHAYVAWLSASEATGLLWRGDWRDCVERLRVALGSTPGPMGDVKARLTAALLAVRQGRLAEAEAHLERADELFGEHSGFLAFEFDAVRAELAIAKGDTEGAIAAAMTGVQSEGAVPTLIEHLIPLAARAAANEVRALTDRGADPTQALARLRDLRRRYPKVVIEPASGRLYDALVLALQAEYDAEVMRAEADPGAATAWKLAAEAFVPAEDPWEEAYAWWRAAEASGYDRAARHAALRRAHALALDLEARPLLADIESLARTARVSLDTVKPAEPTASLPGLTRREREILAHVLAGRTYGEIARELYISEKTVSVHISNMLRKTGTSSRVELAQLARRLSNPELPGGPQ
jgi:DNA-binding CsgD family transcriptional regulator/tetratricopeptide (TPR) repeat protein